jgi:repressor of nif and glnA expression
MRKSGAWMTIWDDRILEIVREKGSGTAAELVEEKYIRISKSSISRRLNILADHKMLDRLGNGVYVITEKGINYLEGELDAEKLDETNGEGEARA